MALEVVFERLAERLKAIDPTPQPKLKRIYQEAEVKVAEADFPLAVIRIAPDVDNEFHLHAVGNSSSGKTKHQYFLEVTFFLGLLATPYEELNARGRLWPEPILTAIAADTALARAVFDMGERGEGKDEYRLGTYRLGVFKWLDGSDYYGLRLKLGPYVELLTMATG